MVHARSRTRVVQMKPLFENAGTILTITLAALFASAVVYSSIFFNSISYDFFLYVSFSDIVNVSIRTAVPLLFFSAVALLVYLVYHIIVFAPWPLRDKLLTWARLPVQVFRFLTYILFAFILLWFFYKMLLSNYYQEFGDLRLPKSFIGWVWGGLIISYCILMTLQIVLGRPIPEFAPLLLALPLLVAVVAMIAAFDARRVFECKHPVEVMYTLGGSDKPIHQELCSVVPLDRGLLLYDKQASETIFVPWAQLMGLTSAVPPLTGKQTQDQPATERLLKPAQAPAPSTPRAASGNGPPAGDARDYPPR